MKPKPDAEKKRGLSLTLDKENYARLTEEAERLGLTRSATLRAVLRKFWSSLGGLNL